MITLLNSTQLASWVELWQALWARLYTAMKYEHLQYNVQRFVKGAKFPRFLNVCNKPWWSCKWTGEYCVCMLWCYLFQLWSDFVYGSCIDGFLKSQAGDCEPGDRGCPSVYMYLFTPRSEFEPLPFWMGKNSHISRLYYYMCVIEWKEFSNDGTALYPGERGWEVVVKEIGWREVGYRCPHFCQN